MITSIPNFGMHTKLRFHYTNPVYQKPFRAVHIDICREEILRKGVMQETKLVEEKLTRELACVDGFEVSWCMLQTASFKFCNLFLAATNLSRTQARQLRVVLANLQVRPMVGVKGLRQSIETSISNFGGKASSISGFCSRSGYSARRSWATVGLQLTLGIHGLRFQLS